MHETPFRNYQEQEIPRSRPVCNPPLVAGVAVLGSASPETCAYDSRQIRPRISASLPIFQYAEARESDGFKKGLELG